MRKVVVRVLLSLMLGFCLMAVPAVEAKAQLGDAYDYHVRVFEGNRGNVTAPSGHAFDVSQHDDYIDFTVPAGSEFTLDRAWISVLDKWSDIYYVKGFRLAGADYGTDNRLENLVFEVNEDMDFVVAYGVEGDMADYQVVYVLDGTGEELGRSEVYHGNVGDRPVAAYEYISGYRPLYRNITGTLKLGLNEWRLPYVKVSSDSGTGTESGGTTTAQPSTSTTTTTVSSPSSTTGTTSVTDTTTTGTGVSGESGSDGTSDDGIGTETDEATDGTPSDEVIDDGVSTESGVDGDGTADDGSGAGDGSKPEEILDVDNPMVDPSAIGDGSDNGTSDGRDGIPVGLLVVVGIVLVIILVIVIYFVITKSVEDEEMAELEDLLGKRQGEKDE